MLEFLLTLVLLVWLVNMLLPWTLMAFLAWGQNREVKPSPAVVDTRGLRMGAPMASRPARRVGWSDLVICLCILGAAIMFRKAGVW